MKTILPIFFLFIFQHSHSQNVKNINFECKYIFTINEDSINSKSEIYNLEFNNISSRYYSDTKRIKDSILRDNYKRGISVEEILANSNQYNTSIFPTEIYNYAGDNFLTVFENILSTKYQYKDSIKPNSWIIFKDTLSINGVSCQLAKLNFRGRYYLAWFAPSISIPFGPWKFYGLPGLIFKVFDTTKKYSFELVNFKQVNDNKEIVPYKGMVIKSNAKDVALLKQRMIEDPIQQLELATGTKITIDSGKEQLMSMFQKEQSNYKPLELKFED